MKIDKEMGLIYIEEKQFEKVDFAQHPIGKGEYENCVFKSCNFLNSDLTDVRFITCTFADCDLSLVKLSKKTAFCDVKFKDCKMLGVRFENCNEFGFLVDFENCLLNDSSFFGSKIKKTIFRNSQMHEVDFTASDLTSAVFDNCDLARARFEKTNLEKADLRTAFNYSIDPEMNRIKRAKFSLGGISGLLSKYDIEITNYV